MGLFGGGFGTLLGGVIGAATGGLAYPIIGAGLDMMSDKKSAAKAENRAYDTQAYQANAGS